MKVTINGTDWIVDVEAATLASDLFGGELVEPMERSLAWSLATKAIWGAAWYLNNGRNLRPGLEQLAATVKKSLFSPEPGDVAKIVYDAAKAQTRDSDELDPVVEQARGELTQNEFKQFMLDRSNTRDNDMARYRAYVAENGGEVREPVVDYVALVRATYAEWQSAYTSDDPGLNAPALDMKSIEKVIESLNKLKVRSFSLQDRAVKRQTYAGVKGDLPTAFDFARAKVQATADRLKAIWLELDASRETLGAQEDPAGILGLDGVSIS